MLGCCEHWGEFRGFRNDLIGAVPGGDGPSLSEAVITVAEEGQAGADQGPGGHVLAVTPVDALAWQWRQASSGCHGRACVALPWALPPSGGYCFASLCRVMLSLALGLIGSVPWGEQVLLCPQGPDGAAALPRCASALTLSGVPPCRGHRCPFNTRHSPSGLLFPPAFKEQVVNIFGFGGQSQ